MLDYDKRMNEAYSKLKYEDQAKVLRELERRNTISDCQSSNSKSSSSSENNIIEPLVNATVNCMQYIVELFVDVSVGLYKGFKAYHQYKKNEAYTKNMDKEVLAEITITKED